MAKQEIIERDGEVIESLPDTRFKVLLDPIGDEEEGQEVEVYLRGKMKRYRISILPGDRVKVEVDPKYPELGRITYRYKA